MCYLNVMNAFIFRVTEWPPIGETYILYYYDTIYIIIFVYANLAYICMLVFRFETFCD